MIALLGLLVACGGGTALDAPHAPPEWPVAARPTVAPVAPIPPATEVAPVPVEAPTDTDATP